MNAALFLILMNAPVWSADSTREYERLFDAGRMLNDEEVGADWSCDIVPVYRDPTFRAPRDFVLFSFSKTEDGYSTSGKQADFDWAFGTHYTVDDESLYSEFKDARLGCRSIHDLADYFTQIRMTQAGQLIALTYKDRQWPWPNELRWAALCQGLQRDPDRVQVGPAPCRY